MDKEILKRNIEQVIMQPCVDNAQSRNGVVIMRHGVRDMDDVIIVKTEPNDSSAIIHLTWNGERLDYVQRILDSLPAKYREHLVTLRHDEKWLWYAYLPVFDTDTQAAWDAELENYLSAKQAWCDMHGCD